MSVWIVRVCFRILPPEPDAFGRGRGEPIRRALIVSPVALILPESPVLPGESLTLCMQVSLFLSRNYGMSIYFPCVVWIKIALAALKRTANDFPIQRNVRRYVRLIGLVVVS